MCKTLPKKRVMRRQAHDNAYLHKDFHGVLSGGLAYLEEEYGMEAVRAFIRRFVREYHAPLRQAIREDGLAALRAYIEKIYRIEGARAEIEENHDSLVVRLEACPAILHIRAKGYPMRPSFHETSGFLYEALCEETPLKFSTELLNPETGERRMVFSRRETGT